MLFWFRGSLFEGLDKSSDYWREEKAGLPVSIEGLTYLVYLVYFANLVYLLR